MPLALQPRCAAPRCRSRGRALQRCSAQRSLQRCSAQPRPTFGNEERNDAAETPPLVLPDVSLTPRQAVSAQLAALAVNDTPRREHGLEVCYRFALGTGGFGLSKYFGYSADLYHFGHFVFAFRTHRAALVDHRSFEVLRDGAAGAGGAEGPHQVDVSVQPRDGAASRWRFTLLRGDLGRTAGCWLTDAISPLD